VQGLGAESCNVGKQRLSRAGRGTFRGQPCECQRLEETLLQSITTCQHEMELRKRRLNLKQIELAEDGRQFIQQRAAYVPDLILLTTQS
jgi:hypothetical protein